MIILLAKRMLLTALSPRRTVVETRCLMESPLRIELKMLGIVLLTAMLFCGCSQPCPAAPRPILVSRPAPTPTPASSELDAGFTGFGVLWGHTCVQIIIDAPTTGGRGAMRARDGAGSVVELSYVVDGHGADVSAVHFPTDTAGGRASIHCTSRLSVERALRLDGIPLHPTYAQCQRSVQHSPKAHQLERELPSCWDAVGDALTYVRRDWGYHVMRGLDKAPREWLERLQFGASFFNANDGCRRWLLHANDLYRGRITRAEDIDGMRTRVAYDYWVDVDDAGALSIELGARGETKYREGGWAEFSTTSGIRTKRTVAPGAADTLGVDGWFTSRRRCDAR